MKKFISFLLFLFLIFFTSLAISPRQVKASEPGGVTPPKPEKFWAKSGPNAGEVTLHWEEAKYANRYSVAYGTKSNEYLYGADNIGGIESRSYTVKSLNPGTKYYFRLSASNNEKSSPFSDEIWVYAAGGVVAKTETRTGMTVTEAKSQAMIKAETAFAPLVDKPSLKAMSGPGLGVVTLSWAHVDSAEDYHLVYGESANDYQYGVLNIGRVNSFTVNYLSPGKAYYFAIMPLVGGNAIYTTNPVKAYAGGPVVADVVKTTLEALRVPTPLDYSSQGVGNELPVGYPTTKP